MLEKIGLPAKPSLRGSTWVVDASHCQGCSSQFTFINRKHHCRRCGGLFCNSCTHQRMVLRGQGDSPVRICDPCKKLEEAARFELRHGYRNRAAKGSSKMVAKHEDDVLSEILGTDGDAFSSSESTSSMDRISYKPKGSSSSPFSNITETAGNDWIELQLETGSASPEELRRQAMEEKKKYRVLKGEGKSEEALRAFKKGKEIERQAEALEMSLRKNRKRALSLGNVDVQSKGAANESGKTRKPPHLVGKEKEDFASELRELGWTDDDDKKPASLSLEGELTSLLREAPTRTSQEKGNGIDKTQVFALKKKALMLKREGKLAEAKEELKRAKILERQLEEQELLAGVEDSDDELSAIICSMDDDKEDDLLGQYEQSRDLDIGNLMGNVDHPGVDGDLDVTEEDMVDPEIAAALKSLGWTEDSRQSDGTFPLATPSNREGCLAEIQSLKKEALNLKRAGNVAQAMATLKKAKLLEKELEAANVSSKAVDMAGGNSYDQRDLGPQLGPKSRLVIQKELLAVKKKALALRREGRFDEAEEELKQGTALQSQLDALDDSSKAKAVISGHQIEDLVNDQPDISGKSLDDDREVDVTDQDLNDPKYLSLLRSLGWNAEDNKPHGSSLEAFNQGGSHGKTVEAQDAKDILGTAPRRSKTQIQRELLGLKRKALTLRRQGNADEAEEVLKQTKALEAQIADIDSGKNLQADQNQLKKKSTDSGIHSGFDEVDDDVTEKDMKDPAFLTVLKNLGWEDDGPTSSPLHERPLKQALGSSMQSSGPTMATKTKGQIQRELLDLKRKALALRRKGETGEAEEMLRKAHALEAQMAELEAPKNEPMLDASQAGDSLENELLVNHGNHQNAISEVGVSKVWIMHDASSDTKLDTKGSVPPISSPNYMDVDLLAEFGRKEAKTDDCFPGNDNTSIPSTSQLAQDNYPLLGEYSPSDEAGTSTKHGMDLLTGEYVEGTQVPAGKGKDESESDLGVPSLTRPIPQTGSPATPERKSQSSDNTEQRALHGYLKPDNYDASSVQNVSSMDSQHSLRQEILAHKRKAVALKREGKLIEAKDALRQAKLLEKSLDRDNSPPKKPGPDDPVSATQASSAGQKENSPSSSAPKPLSGRDRFKLQQESLSHKRQALKLRREGQLQEAEAEFEMAKALEAQLEESTSYESSKSEPVDDVFVDDFLDPQLLSALKAIGLDDAIGPSKSPEKLVSAKTSPDALKPNTAKESPSQERAQLEERIKAEKVKAVTLKRAGRQTEALDALRRAKLYEKKLNALASY